jgi:hypothetical protein
MSPNSDTQPNFIKWFREVFGFSDQVATALYDDQLFKDAMTIAEFGDSEVDSVCRTLRRDSNLKLAELSVTRLKLMTFWVRHQYRTSHVIGGVGNPLVRIDLKTITLLKVKEQKRLEDGWAANSKEPEYTTIALDIASAAIAFEKVKTILTRVRGVLGVPLVYVIQRQLFPEEERDDPAFGDDNDKKPQYTSHNHEMITRCPIVDDNSYTESYDDSEANGPFVPTFLTDSKKV